MRFFDHIPQAFSVFWANKLRSVLTMLGVIIGIFSVILMVGIGQGAQESVSERLRSLGTNVLIVTPGGGSDIRSLYRGSGNGSLEISDVDLISTVPNILAVLPEVQVSKQAVYQKTNQSLRITGVTPEYLQVKQVEFLSGRTLSQEDVSSVARVLVIASDIEEELFGGDALGRSVRLENAIYTVVGVTDADDATVYAPITTAQVRLAGRKAISQISVFTTSEEIMDTVQTDIESVLLASRNIADMDSADFSVLNQSDMLETLNEITGVFTLMLGGISGISLLVGGIGVMNIMLVSVTERTREIGIRKAIGAHNTDILLQFLVESVLLSCMGGIIGVSLSLLGAYLLGVFNIAVSIQMSSIALASGFSVFVGVVFGILPAYKASQLQPIDALRFE